MRTAIAAGVGLALFAGCSAVGATSTGDSPAAVASQSALFDATVVHDIDVTFDAAAYDAMIEAFQSTGDNEWIEATVSIDGTTFPRVGLRLKGIHRCAG